MSRACPEDLSFGADTAIAPPVQWTRVRFAARRTVGCVASGVMCPMADRLVFGTGIGRTIEPGWIRLPSGAFARLGRGAMVVRERAPDHRPGGGVLLVRLDRHGFVGLSGHG